MRRRLLAAGLAAAVLASVPASASPEPAQPYAGLAGRPVKALSDEQVAALRSGRGMGLALAAELNGYPGPVHALELAQPLGLSEAQRSRMRELVAAVTAEAVPLGERIIAAETELDGLFARRTVTEAGLREATAAVARLQGELRAAHLRYHLTTLAALTDDQARRYGELRGYAGRTPPHRH